jgi:type IV secretory pathway TraG/TraD family ATPase VirD4
MFSWFTGWHIVLSIIIGLIALGFALTCAFGIMKGMLWCLSLTATLIGRPWAWLTGKPPSSHGTAHFATEAEITAKGLLQPGSIPLGTWHGKPLYEAMGGHVALIGPPRSRKSWGLLMPAIDGFESSILVNDPRGELWTHTHTAREAKGPTYRFSPTQKDSCAINVLDAVRWGESEAFGDVQRLVHGLLSPDPGEVQSPFAMEAEPLLTAIIHDRQAAGEGHLPSVVAWMTAPGASMKQKAEALLSSPIQAVSAGGRRFLDKSDRLQSSVWSAALSALTIYQDPLVAASTSHSDLDLTELQHGSRPVSLYLTPPFSDVPRLRPLLGTLTEMLVSRFSAQQDTPRQKVLLALDELANLGRLDEVERGTSFLQGCGVQVLAVFQNIQQFRFAYGPHSPLLASIGTSVWYCPGDPETSEYLSEQCGVTTARLRPLSEHRSFWGLLTSSTIGTTEHERRLLTSDECRRLPETAAVIIAKGMAPVLGEKLGAPPQEIMDLSNPRRRLVATGFAAVFILGLVGWAWVLRTPTPPPALSVPTMTPTALLPTPFSATPTSEARRIPVTLDYRNAPAHLMFPDRPATVTGEFLATDPAAFAQEVRLTVDLSAARHGLNYFLLMPKTQIELPEGLTMPTSAWTGVDPRLQPSLLTLTAEYAPDAPKPYVLQELKSKHVLSRHVEAADCQRAHLAAVATTKAVLSCQRQP